MDLYTLALKQARRHPARSISTIAAIAVIVALMAVSGSLALQARASLAKARMRLGADAVVMSAAYMPPPGGALITGAPLGVYMPEAVLNSAASHPSVAAASPQLFIASAQLPCCTVSDTVLVGFDPAADFTVSAWLRQSNIKSLGEGELLAGDNIVNEPGGHMEFFGKLFTVKGKLDRTGVEHLDSTLYMTMESARAMIAGSATGPARLDIPPHSISAVMVRFRDEADQERAALDLEFRTPGISVVLASEAMRSASSMIRAPLYAAGSAMALMFLGNVLILAALHYLTLSERRRDAALMRALGGMRSAVRNVFLIEAAMLFLCGALIGVMSGAVLRWALVIAGVQAATSMRGGSEAIAFLVLPACLAVPYLGFALHSATGLSRTSPSDISRV